MVGAFEAWLAHRSLATLALRLERSAARARWRSHARLRERGVEVFHPSDHAASAQMQHYGCLVGFVLESEARAQDVLARCELVAEATSFGGVHATAERRDRWGTDDVPPGFIRYSAGIEDPEDLVADLAPGPRLGTPASSPRRRRGSAPLREKPRGPAGEVAGLSLMLGGGWPGVNRRSASRRRTEGVPGAVWRRESRVRRSLCMTWRAAEPMSAPRLCQSDFLVAAALRGVNPSAAIGMMRFSG